LLLQQAKKEGVAAPKGGSATPPAAGEDAETATIMAYLDKKMADLPPASPRPAKDPKGLYGQAGGVDHRCPEQPETGLRLSHSGDPDGGFFDPAGKEIFRHQGFMSEEKVKEQLAKMGVV